MNMDGSRVADITSVYDASGFTLLGLIQDNGTGSYIGNVELSPDGTRAYLLTVSGSSISEITVFDTTQRTPGTSYLVKIGSIPLKDQATDITGQYYSISAPQSYLMSPLGDTLFLVGDLNFIVVPIPASLAKGEPQPQRLQTLSRQSRGL